MINTFKIAQIDSSVCVTENYKASQHTARFYSIISITLIKSYTLLIETCTGSQAVT